MGVSKPQVATVYMYMYLVHSCACACMQYLSAGILSTFRVKESRKWTQKRQTQCTACTVHAHAHVHIHVHVYVHVHVHTHVLYMHMYQRVGRLSM